MCDCKSNCYNNKLKSSHCETDCRNKCESMISNLCGCKKIHENEIYKSCNCQQHKSHDCKKSYQHDNKPVKTCNYEDDTTRLIYKKKCSHDPSRMNDLLVTVKVLYERLTKDVCQYARELEKFQDYYQRFDLNNEDMFLIMHKKIDILLELFFISVSNHLSISTNVKGVGEKIIKPVKDYGKSTTIKYQNICKTCADCDKKSYELCHSKNRFVGCRDFLKVQTTINVATYDNISIFKLFSIDCKSLLGYVIEIGNLQYNLRNYTAIKNTKKCDKITNQVEEIIYDDNGCPERNDDGVIMKKKVDKVTDRSIDELFEFIDNQVRILGDIEMALSTNIEYVNKYIRKFNCNISC